jgi:hypothetical protein
LLAYIEPQMRNSTNLAYATVVLATFCLGAGCASTGEDSNIAVFQTAQAVAERRQEEQLKRWQEMALAIAREERPGVGVQAAPDGAFGLVMTADGVRQEIDLEPLKAVLAAQSGRAGMSIREHLRRILPEFDQKRLAQMSFEQVRGKLRPMLINGAQLLEIQTSDRSQEIYPATTIAGGLHWLPGVRWSPEAISPVGPGALRAWNVDAAEVSRAALENAAREINAEMFDTSELGSLGRIGQLKGGVEPGVVLTPGFLATVRKVWGTTDEIVVLAASPTDIRFLQEDRRDLLDKLWPQWEMATRMNRQPLALRPFLLTDGGATAMAYNPPEDVYRSGAGARPVGGSGRGATQPATPPWVRRSPQPAANRGAESKPDESSAANRHPATRPSRPGRPGGRPYIVR